MIRLPKSVVSVARDAQLPLAAIFLGLCVAWTLRGEEVSHEGWSLDSPSASVSAPFVSAPPQIDDAIWRLLMKTDYVLEEGAWVLKFPPEVERLDGTIVSIEGYMIPLSYDEKQTQFLISAYPGDGCFFHLPGGPNSAVAVDAVEGVDFTYETTTVTGTLELLHDDPYGMIYRLNKARPAK